MTAVLIVEDEKDLVSILEYNLKRDGYAVASATTGAEALEVLSQDPLPDLVLLDIMLPDISGIEICRRLRSDDRTKHLLVVMLTARGEEIDRVVGFEIGADDYVVKPFSVRELLLRIRALSRRLNAPVPSKDAILGQGDLRIDTAAHRVWVGDAEIELTALEFRLLTTLFERRGRVQSRSTLLTDVWTMSSDVMTRTVDTHVKRLREKLASAGDFIETVRGVGYRFTAKDSGQD